ncbi:hypothetical protein [Dactylosporangium sp. NPDC051484]|uniref:hypothetical protein n=1 Tax=Dactylosporangium sp. NPDC051484 TaxID=3154942 RepID=UPI00344C1BA5
MEPGRAAAGAVRGSGRLPAARPAPVALADGGDGLHLADLTGRLAGGENAVADLKNPRYTGFQVWNKQRTDEVLVDDVAMVTPV